MSRYDPDAWPFTEPPEKPPPSLRVALVTPLRRVAGCWIQSQCPGCGNSKGYAVRMLLTERRERAEMPLQRAVAALGRAMGAPPAGWMTTEAVLDQNGPSGRGRAMDQELKEQVIATYTTYIDAFLANDVEALNKLMQYPLAYIGNGRVTMVETFPVQPAELMAAKQWHTTKDIDPEVVFLSTEKAHVAFGGSHGGIANRPSAHGGYPVPRQRHNMPE